MTIYVALLRGINVGGHKQVPMADLRQLLTKLDLSNVSSLLQSGNLLFRAEARSTAELERLLEAGAERHLGLQTDIYVRSAQEWQTIIEHNPFPQEAEHDPSHLVVMFLKDAPISGSVEALQAAITGPEVVRSYERHAYIVYPAGIGQSRLTNVLIEKKLGTRGTARNWNTILKLGALTAV